MVCCFLLILRLITTEQKEERLTTSWGDHLVKKFGVSPFPDLLDDSSQFLIGLVDVALHLDPKWRPHQRKQCGIEHDRTVAVQGHVHGHQALKK